MKAPDTIYLNEDGYGVQTGWSTYPSDILSSHEYIRKDALIEWLKGYNYPVTLIVVQELIDKINEL